MGQLLTEITTLESIIYDIKSALVDCGYNVNGYPLSFWPAIISSKAEVTDEQMAKINELLTAHEGSSGEELAEYLEQENLHPKTLVITSKTVDEDQIIHAQYHNKVNYFDKLTNLIIDGGVENPAYGTMSTNFHFTYGTVPLKSVLVTNCSNFKGSISCPTVKQFTVQKTEKIYPFPLYSEAVETITLNGVEGTTDDGQTLFL